MSSIVGKYIYSTTPIGKGSFSRVYKGFNVENDALVAVKRINRTSLKETLVKRLHHEITLLGELDHPNIVQLMDFLEDEKYWYLVLEYCSGGDLAGLLRKGRLPEDRAKGYLRQLSDGLQYLRTKNLIHRDLKPQNILLSGDQETLKLTDFNFARELLDTDLAQTLCGSPLYMAPEILAEGKYTAKSDLWSVGLILYEMVYGKSPFRDALNVIDLRAKINTRKIQYNSTVSDDCNDLLQGLLKIDAYVRMSWPEFFTHPWIDRSDPEPVQIPMWQSVSASVLHTNEPTPPMRIPNHFRAHLIDDYEPIGVTPPRYASSAPLPIHRVCSPPDSSRLEEISQVSPKTVSDHFWDYMSASVGALKGAFRYISTENLLRND